jgi:DNA-binding XRE family transcriptional regulator
MNKLEIGKTVQKRREKLSLKQEDLAEMTGITSKTIYLIETGKGNPSINTLTKLIEVLGLEINVSIKKIEA